MKDIAIRKSSMLEKVRWKGKMEFALSINGSWQVIKVT